MGLQQANKYTIYEHCQQMKKNICTRFRNRKKSEPLYIKMKKKK